MEENKRIILGLDVSSKTIGVTILIDDGSEYGNIIEMTHISPNVPNKITGIEQLFIKKQIFEKFISKFKNIGITDVIIEEPLMRSNNIVTCSTLLRFNGMISDCIYNIFNVVPKYISSYDARKYSFPELMGVRKYGKDGSQYDFSKIKVAIEKNRFVLFGSYSWEVDKKIIIHDKVSEIFPNIQWVYDKNGELKKQNFDASDSYVCVLAMLNKERHGELEFNAENIAISQIEGEANKFKIEYDLKYWDKSDHRITYAEKQSKKQQKTEETKKEETDTKE